MEETCTDVNRQNDSHVCKYDERLVKNLHFPDDGYKCGGCHVTLKSICLLHEHLLKEFLLGSYLFDCVSGTAFPRNATADTETQTESGNFTFKRDRGAEGCQSVNSVTVSKETQTENCHNDSKEKPTYIGIPKRKYRKRGREKVAFKSKRSKRTWQEKPADTEDIKLELEDRNNVNDFKQEVDPADVVDDVVEEKQDVVEVKQEIEDNNYDESTDDNLDFDITSENFFAESKDNNLTRNKLPSKLRHHKKKVTRSKYKKKHTASKDEHKLDTGLDSNLGADEESENAGQTETNLDSEQLGKRPRSKYLRVGCSHCKQTYFSQKKLNIHLYNKHKQLYPFACKPCNWALFKNAEELSQHQQEHQQEIFHCDLCGKDLRTKEGIRLHRQTHLKFKPFKCDQCDYESHTRNSLRQHMYTHADSRSEQCELCGRAFYTKSKLREHLRYCRKEFKHYCPYCEKGFVARGSMEKHVFVHTGERTFVCDVCGFATTTAFLLKGHMRTHTGEKPFKCKECGAQLASRNTLQRHLRTHSHEKPYVCSYCCRAFTSKWNLRTHLRQHTGEAPYKCDICGQGFKQNVLRKTHMRGHTESTSVDLTLSKKSSKSASKQHLLDQHEAGPETAILPSDVTPSIAFIADLHPSDRTDVTMTNDLINSNARWRQQFETNSSPVICEQIQKHANFVQEFQT